MLATQFQNLADSAVAAYRRALCDAATGVEVDPSDVLHKALAAGRSAVDMPGDLETAVERFNASQTAAARDFDAELAEARETRKARTAKLIECQKAFDLASTNVRAAHEADQASLARVHRLDRERQEAVNDLAATLRATGDASDWTKFTL